VVLVDDGWIDASILRTGRHADEPWAGRRRGHPRHAHQAKSPTAGSGCSGTARPSRSPSCDLPMRSDGRGVEPKGSMRASPGGVATSLATQALLSAGTGRHWMKSVPLPSSQDGPGRVQLEDFGPTRNRKVEGSNPSSGSKTAGQGLPSKTSIFGWIRWWQPEHLNSGR
jgi:hypothetical protein